MSVYELGDFIFQNYYKPIGFSKGNSYYSMKRLKDLFLIANKLIEKIPHPCNAEKYYQSFVRSVKKSEDQKISKTIRNNYLSTQNF